MLTTTHDTAAVLAPPPPVGQRVAGAREFVRRPAVGPQSTPLGAADEHRLALHTALTAAGVAPVPGDRSAVYAVATLDAETVRSVIAWIGTAAAR
ncbi:hypothetical protein [Streptomyces oceani]|uniref:hypothetical protein n=1 Tax=Streptomyces oceani TaxID=1075402 RepID=UPI0008733550|nr:hypothetical protein [Streptomyces oceani]